MTGFVSTLNLLQTPEVRERNIEVALEQTMFYRTSFAMVHLVYGPM